MASALRQGMLAAFAVAVAYILILIALAGFEQIILSPFFSSGSMASLSFIAMLGYVGAVLMNIPPVVALYLASIRARWPYLATGALSAPLAAYCFVFIAGVVDNAGAILKHVPTATGWTYRVPSFGRTLVSAFGFLPRVVREVIEAGWFAVFTVMLVGALGAFLASLSWRLVWREGSR